MIEPDRTNLLIAKVRLVASLDKQLQPIKRDFAGLLDLPFQLLAVEPIISIHAGKPDLPTYLGGAARLALPARAASRKPVRAFRGRPAFGRPVAGRQFPLTTAGAQDEKRSRPAHWQWVAWYRVKVKLVSRFIALAMYSTYGP
jgi:hypothetical protein